MNHLEQVRDEATAEDSVRPSWLDRQRWPHRLRQVEIDGAPATYTDEGDGPTLLLVHAGFWTYIWRDLIAELKRDHRLIAPELPGHGIMDAPDGYEPSPRRHAEFLARFIEELGLERYTLVMHDLGGHVGIRAALDRPERVEAMVLINTFAWQPDGRRLRAMLRLMGSRPITGLDRATNLIPRISSSRFGVGRQLGRADRQAFRRPFARGGRRTRNFHLLMRAVIADDELTRENERQLSETFGDLPVATIFGERNDPFGFQERFREVFEKAPEELVIADGNHFPMCDDPNGVGDFIRHFSRRAIESVALA